MSMKLSRRDKVIFLILVVVAVFIAGGLLLIKPKYEDMKAAQARLEAKEAEKQELVDKIATLDGLKQQLKDNVNSVVEKQSTFIDEREYSKSYQLAQYIEEMLLEAAPNIEIISIDFPNTQSSTISLDDYLVNGNVADYQMKFDADIAHLLDEEQYNAHEGTWPARQPGVITGGGQITVSYQLPQEDIESVYNIIDAVADNDKRVYLNSISADYVNYDDIAGGSTGNSMNADEAHLEGDITLTVHEIYYMDPADIDAATPEAAPAEEPTEEAAE